MLEDYETILSEKYSYKNYNNKKINTQKYSSSTFITQPQNLLKTEIKQNEMILSINLVHTVVSLFDKFFIRPFMAFKNKFIQQRKFRKITNLKK